MIVDSEDEHSIRGRIDQLQQIAFPFLKSPVEDSTDLFLLDDSAIGEQRGSIASIIRLATKCLIRALFAVAQVTASTT